jgi:hypothetical protein
LDEKSRGEESIVLYFNPWVEASAGGLLVSEGLFSPVAKYFGTCLKYEYE